MSEVKDEAGTAITDSSENQHNQSRPKSKIASRKSARKRQAPRPYSPPHDDLDSISSANSRRKQAFPRRNPRSATAADRKFDILPNGEPFSCHLCKSPYVINRWSKHAYKDRRSKHNPTPRSKLDPKTGKEIYLCNACCVTLERPRKKKKSRPLPTAEDKQDHLDQCEAFGREFVEVVGQSFAKNLYCPAYNAEPCNCLQKYCRAKGDTEESLHRMKEIYKLHVRAKELSKLKCYETPREPNSLHTSETIPESYKGHDTNKSSLQSRNDGNSIETYTVLSQQYRPEALNSLQERDQPQPGVPGNVPSVSQDNVQYSDNQVQSVVTQTGRVAGHIILQPQSQSNSKKRKRKQSVVIGLGNGQKRSKVYESYVFEKRTYLKQKLDLCERAVQRILCYSNNFLHKRLKTENKLCRIKPDEGYTRRSKLLSMDTISETPCCIDSCTVMALTHRRLLLEWRERAQKSQAEARRVIAEMLVPSAGLRCNCYCFITMVTGVSRSTITRVKVQMLETGGDKEPPVHGMKKYKMEQQAGPKKDKEKGSTQQRKNIPSNPNVSKEKPSSHGPVQVVTENHATSSNAEIQRQQLLQLQHMFDEQKKQQMVLQQLLHQTLVAGPTSNSAQNEGLIQQVIDQLNVQIQNNQAQLQQSLQQLVAIGAVSLIPDNMVPQHTTTLQACPQPSTCTQPNNQQVSNIPNVGSLAYVPNTAPFVQDIVLTVPTTVGNDSMGRNVQQQIILADAGNTPVAGQVVLQKQVALAPSIQQPSALNSSQGNLGILTSPFQSATSDVNLSQPLIQYATGPQEMQSSHDGFLQNVPHQEYRITELQPCIPIPQGQSLNIIVQRDNQPSQQDSVSGNIVNNTVEHFPQMNSSSDQQRSYPGSVTYQSAPVVISSCEASLPRASKAVENHLTSSSSAAVPNVMIVSPNSAFVTFMKDKHNPNFTNNDESKIPACTTRIASRHPVISENLQRKSQTVSVPDRIDISKIQKGSASNKNYSKNIQSFQPQNEVHEKQNLLPSSSSSQNLNYPTKQILIQGTFKPISDKSQESSVCKILAQIVKDSKPSTGPSDKVVRNRNTLMVCRKVDFGEQTDSPVSNSVGTGKSVYAHRNVQDSSRLNPEVQVEKRSQRGISVNPNKQVINISSENNLMQKLRGKDNVPDSVMKSSSASVSSDSASSSIYYNTGRKGKSGVGSEHQKSPGTDGQTKGIPAIQKSTMDSPVKQQRTLAISSMKNSSLSNIQVHTVNDPNMLLQLLEKTANETGRGKNVKITSH